jgi:hypothetical protein
MVQPRQTVARGGQIAGWWQVALRLTQLLQDDGQRQNASGNKYRPRHCGPDPLRD